MKFLRFWTKKKTFNFWGFFFSADWKSWHRKNIVCITWSDVTINNWCTLHWSLEVKAYLVLCKVFKGYSFWIRNYFFPCLRDLFCWQEIWSQQLNRYQYNVWYFGCIFLKSNFHTLAYNNCFKRIKIKINLWIIFNTFSIM